MQLSEWISAERGRAALLAEGLGLANPSNPVLVYQWANGSRQVPAERCPAIERLTEGAVRCETLRGDVDWAVLRRTTAASEAA